MKTRVILAAAGVVVAAAFASFLAGCLKLFTDDVRYGDLSGWGVFMFLHTLIALFVWYRPALFLLLRFYPVGWALLSVVCASANQNPSFVVCAQILNGGLAALSLAELYYAWKWSKVGVLRRDCVKG